MSGTSTDARVLDTPSEVEAAVLSGRLERCTIRRQDLVACPMEGVQVVDTTFFEVGLAGARLRGARMRDSSFEGAMMRGADLSRAVIEGCLFRGSEAMEAVFRNADLVSSRFVDTPCGNASFEGAEVVGSLFSTSDLYAARFAHAILVRCRFENRRLGNAVLSRADFSNAFILDCDFSNADLADADFRGALLVRANFEDANLTGAKFDGARLLMPNLARVNLQAAERAALNAATVRPEDGVFQVLEFLAARSERLVPVVHALLVGYVLGGVRALETAPTPAQAPPAPAPPEPAPPPQPAPSQAPVQKAPTAVREAPHQDGAARAPRESEPVYERFKKIELD